ncbi:LysM [Glarea lozoyensis ATCC 20868]|uniref:LysM n=1 Tax=Glarea lozoyensis (strain ATCC 20868 / MF5171) TaxID=1116229 RepID=S3DBU3_GLAL2|nr:LysM [Glarea lozoyensis ATCC 20868]EPE35195.1 LysM [Glarea lozoyensis ATCC 20868]
MLANINMKILVSIASVMISTKVAAVVIHPRDCSFTWAAEIEDTCQSMASSWEITEAQFISYNPGVVCSALVAGKEYCVEWVSTIPTTSSSTSSSMQSTTSTRDSTTLITGPATSTAKPTSSTTKSTTATTTTSTAPTGPVPTQTGITSDCKSYYLAVAEDTCNGIVSKFGGGFTLQQFYNWNLAITGDCGGLWAGYYYCVGVPGTPTGKPTTTKTSVTPAPTGKLISEDGICGFNGRTCVGSQFGNCCSKNFYCGSSLDYCAMSNGCLAAFGTCQATTVDGICGFNGRTCLGGNFGDCCSRNFYCGSSLDSCSVSSGCLSSFGTCQAVTQDGICGFNGRTCIGGNFGNCCSKNFYCGASTDYCASRNCLPGFGNCNAT